MHIIRFERKDVDTCTYVVPSLVATAPHLLPSLPFHDVEALEVAAWVLGWPLTWVENGHVIVQCPHALMLRFAPSPAGMWHLTDPLTRRVQTCAQWHQVSVLAQAYAETYICLEAKRHGWSMTKTTRPDGSMAMTYSQGMPSPLAA